MTSSWSLLVAWGSKTKESFATSTIDDAGLLAMDLEFLGRRDRAGTTSWPYAVRSGITARRRLRDFYIAYRAARCARKSNCVRFSQGKPEAAARLRAPPDHRHPTYEHATVGWRWSVAIKAPALARGSPRLWGTQVISTDDIAPAATRLRVMRGPGVLDSGLYNRANVVAVYQEALRKARLLLGDGHSVILDGTWAIR